jgi:eukaryotic-like serine/threonine-protein kinase
LVYNVRTTDGEGYWEWARKGMDPMSEGEERDNRDLEGMGNNGPAGESSKPHDPRFDATAETFVDNTQIIGTDIGRYHILSVLGEGGGGVVYLAQQNHPIKRRVALKVIKPGMDSKQVIARFEAERQALALLDHPNIAHVFDAGATDLGRPYFVMEFVKGIPVTQFCDQSKLSLQDRLRLFIPLCHAIQHAHQKGIIHRDIKPSNVLVMLDDEAPTPKIIDFGVAKALHQPLTDRTMVTLQGQFVGTPEYMSPEQAEISNLDVDTRTDIYSLGVLLYEILTGCTPFDPKDLRSKGYAEMQRIIREQDPIKPSTRLTTLGGKLEDIARRRSATADQLRKSVRDDLDWIVMKAMEKDRARRYSTAHDLAEDLERHLSNEPVLARPPSKVYRFQKMVRRNKGLFAAVAVVVAVLVLGVIVSSWQAVLATQAKRAESRLLYIANMTLAQQAWEQNNVGRVRQLLDETATYPERGFEWYYWQRQKHLELKALRGHSAWVSSVAFSPDGHRIVTGSGDQTAKVWDVASGKELFTFRGHSAPVVSVAFSPDGQWIATGSRDQTAKVWEANTGKELVTLKGHSTWIWSVAFSPDGQQIVTGSYDRTAKVWETTTGKELFTLKGHDAEISSVAFSPPDGQRIITGSGDQTAKVWDAANGKELFTLKGHSDWVSSVAFSSDGQRIITGSGDQTAKVWDAASGRELLTLKGHSSGINSVAFSPDGQRIATGSRDQTTKIWEASTGKELFTLKGHDAEISSVAFSPPDGQRIVTGSVDQTAKVWEATTDKELLTLKGHSAAVLSGAFSPDGQRIVTGSVDQTAKVLEAATGKELLTLKGHNSIIESAVFSPDGQRIVTGSYDETAKVWEAATGKELLTFKGHDSGISSVAFSSDGQRIVTGTLDETGTTKVWEATTGKELVTLKGHSSGINSVAFSPNGQRIVTGSWDHTAKVWEASTGKELFTLIGHSDGILSVAFSPDNQRIITGSVDKTAKVWDATNGSDLFTLKGHTSVIPSVAFSPDGQRIVTGSYDRTAKVWEAASGKELLTLKGHSAGILWMAFSPDGHRIVTGSDDQTAKVWEAASVEQVASWHKEEQMVAESLAMQQHERVTAEEHDRALCSQDPGAIKQWLVLLPIPFEGDNGAKAVQDEQVLRESELCPRASERINAGGSDLVWRVVELDDYKIDFVRMLGVTKHWSVAYAVSYVLSEASQSRVLLKVSHDDQAKVYLNGKLIYQYVYGQTDGQNVAACLELKAGINVLVFKVVNQTDGWRGSVRLTDADGKPLKGIRVTLDPEAKN